MTAVDQTMLGDATTIAKSFWSSQTLRKQCSVPLLSQLSSSAPMTDWLFASVAVPPLENPLTYLAPKEVTIGSLVRIPLGHRSRYGWVIATSASQPDSFSGTIKSIEENLVGEAVFHPEGLRLFQWCSDYYGTSLSNVIETAIPAFVPPRKTRSVILNRGCHSNITGSLATEIIAFLTSNAENVSITAIKEKFPGRSITQTLNNLEKKGVISIDSHSEPLSLTAPPAPEWAKKEVSLNSAQLQSLGDITKAISTGSFSPFLLYGVTGSGKTEVYIEAILHNLAAGKSSLIIVPEIALTPQLVDRFRARIQCDIGTLHSGLSDRERWQQWMMLSSGATRVALGARSAVFAPMKDLGLIIVDEEHDASFKQSDGLRYHARDLAVVRAHLNSCPIVLGSATPSLETVWNVHRKKYHQLSLPQRHSDHGISPITVIDMNQLSPVEKGSPSISLTLLSALQDCISRGEQAFILFNRRGFSSYLQCEKCGHAVKCPHCSVTLTHHKSRQSLLCHLCGFKIQQPDSCTHCRTLSPKESSTLKEFGSGTERIYEELAALLPEARIGRMDRDTVDSEASHRATLDSVRSGETDVLVGTQMIAKGHDLPKVTLVGVIDGDVGLHLPDFRSSERVFQLLTQVAGRAGRGEKPGSVIIQTRQPKHPSITCTAQRNFFAFASLELQSRRDLLYPPFSSLIRIVVSGQDKEAASNTIGQISELMRNSIASAQLHIKTLGPSPAPFERVRGKWRFHCLFKAKNRADLNKALGMLRAIQIKQKGVKLTWDVDPADML